MDVHVYKDGSYVSGKSVGSHTSTTYSVSLDSAGSWVIYTRVFDQAGRTQNQSPNNGSGWYYQSYTINLSYAATKNTYTATASCSSGYTYSNSTCSISYTNNGAQCGYSCSSGTLSGSNCIVPTQVACGTEDCNCREESVWYCDDQGYDDQGNWVCNGSYVEGVNEVCDSCTKYCDSTKTVAATAKSCTKTDASKLLYSCPNYGASLSGTTCTYYTCPNGGTLSGTTCYY